jgi:hypothetical protein
MQAGGVDGLVSDGGADIAHDRDPPVAHRDVGGRQAVGRGDRAALDDQVEHFRQESTPLSIAIV